jgi:hypothetical protein
MTPFAGHLASRKLLHMDALSSIPRGLAIEMKISQQASIGLNYGPIGRKYWTLQTMGFNLRNPSSDGNLRIVASVLQDARSRTSHA